MHAGLVILMIISGVIFIGSVLLMSPKGGIGLGIGGMWGGNEYGSKKSLEGKIRYVAIGAVAIFLLVSLILPYTK